MTLLYCLVCAAGMELLNKEFNDLVSKYSKQLQPVAVLDLLDRDDGQGAVVEAGGRRMRPSLYRSLLSHFIGTKPRQNYFTVDRCR